jgi:hypothetical protein
MAKPNLDALADRTQNCVLTEPKGKFIWLSISALAFVVIGVFMVRGNNAGDVIAGWVGIVFFGLCLLVGLLKLWVKLDTLTLDQTGLTFTVLGRTNFILWDQITEFGTYNQSGLPLGPKVVGMNFKEVHKTKATAIASSMVGFDGGLPSSYGVKPHVLAEALQRRLAAHVDG